MSFIDNYSEKEKMRIDDMHSSRLPRSEWTDEDFDLYIRFECDKSAEAARQSEELRIADEKAKAELELSRKLAEEASANLREHARLARERYERLSAYD